MSEIKLRVSQYEYGWYIEAYAERGENVFVVYCTDSLMANLLTVSAQDYSFMLQQNGGKGPANNITYFETEAEALSVMQAVDDLLLSVKILGRLTANDVRNKQKSFTVLDF